MTRDEHCRGANACEEGVSRAMAAMMDAATAYLLVVVIVMFSVVLIWEIGLSLTNIRLQIVRCFVK